MTGGMEEKKKKHKKRRRREKHKSGKRGSDSKEKGREDCKERRRKE